MRSNEPGRAQRVVMLARTYPGRTLLLLLVAGVGLYLLAVHLFPSETRKVRTAIAQVRSGIMRGDADRVLDCVSPYFYAEGIDKPTLGTYLRRELRSRPVRQLTIILRQVQFDGDSATADLSVRSIQGGRYLPTDWAVELQKVNGRWMVRSASPTQVGGFPSSGLRALLRIR